MSISVPFTKLVVVGVVVIFLLVAAYAASEPAESVPYKSIELKLRADELSQGTRVIRSADGWQQFWNRYGVGSPPELDFRKQSVALVALGGKPNTGYDVEIVRVERTSINLVILYEQVLPDKNRVYPTFGTYPYDAIVFPKSEKPIVFRASKSALD